MIEINKNKVLFSASWCSPCKLVIADIRRRGLQDEIQVIKVDDDLKEAKDIYRVTSVPTLIYFEDNVETNRFVGVEVNKELDKK